MRNSYAQFVVSAALTFTVAACSRQEPNSTFAPSNATAPSTVPLQTSTEISSACESSGLIEVAESYGLKLAESGAEEIGSRVGSGSSPLDGTLLDRFPDLALSAFVRQMEAFNGVRDSTVFGNGCEPDSGIMEGQRPDGWIKDCSVMPRRKLVIGVSDDGITSFKLDTKGIYICDKVFFKNNATSMIYLEITIVYEVDGKQKKRIKKGSRFIGEEFWVDELRYPAFVKYSIEDISGTQDTGGTLWVRGPMSK